MLAFSAPYLHIKKLIRVVAANAQNSRLALKEEDKDAMLRDQGSHAWVKIIRKLLKFDAAEGPREVMLRSSAISNL